jgi:hypothetical protein
MFVSKPYELNNGKLFFLIGPTCYLRETTVIEPFADALR